MESKPRANQRHLIDIICVPELVSQITSACTPRTRKSDFTVFVPAVQSFEYERIDLLNWIEVIRQQFHVKGICVVPRLSPVRQELTQAKNELLADSDAVQFTDLQRQLFIDRYTTLIDRVNKKLDVFGLSELNLRMQQKTAVALTEATTDIMSDVCTVPDIKDEFPVAKPRQFSNTYGLHMVENSHTQSTSRIPVPTMDLRNAELSLRRLRVFLAAQPNVSWSEIIIRFLGKHLDLVQEAEMVSIRNVEDLTTWVKNTLGFENESVKLQTFQEITQRIDESPGMLWLRLKSAYASIFPGQTSQGDQYVLKDRFYDALLDKDLAFTLRMENPSTESLVNRCTQIKSALNRQAALAQLNRIESGLSDDESEETPEQSEKSEWSDDEVESDCSESEESFTQKSISEEDDFSDSETDEEENSELWSGATF